MSYSKKRNRWICIGLLCVLSVVMTITVYALELDLSAEELVVEQSISAEESDELFDDSEDEEAVNDIQESPKISNENRITASKKSGFPNGITPKGSNKDITLSEEKLLEIVNNASENSSIERLLVVIKAHSLQGKVSYFWGGKSLAIGWDNRWRNQAYVTSPGSSSTGTLRSFGLDCSGYVNWVFNNAAQKDTTSKVGNGTNNQWAESTAVNWNDARPGDLAFFKDVSHVGIVVGRNEVGKLLVAHCTSSRNNVVITEAESSGFRYIRTPNIYNDSDFVASVTEHSLFINEILGLNPGEDLTPKEERVYIIRSYYNK